MFTLLLEAEGAEVTATGAGREAVEIATKGDFDVLLVDRGLPDIPGDIVIRQVVASAPRRPWIVVVTGYGEPYIGRARQAGADVVLTKPIAWSRLLDRLVAHARRAASGLRAPSARRPRHWPWEVAGALFAAPQRYGCTTGPTLRPLGVHGNAPGGRGTC